MFFDFLNFVKDWNFLGPLALWAGTYAVGKARLRSRKVSTWSLRSGKGVLIVVDQPMQTPDYVDGEIGSLSIARSVQRLSDEFDRVGLKVAVVPLNEYHSEQDGNVVFLGRVQTAESRLLTQLQRLGYRAEFHSNSLRVNETVLQAKFEIKQGTLRLVSDEVVLVKGARSGFKGEVVILVGLTAAGVECAVSALTSSSARTYGKQLRKVDAARISVDLAQERITVVRPIE